MNKITKKQIIIIFGGPSGEHEVSLKSAKQVMKSLDANKYEIIPVAITKSGDWLINERGRKYLNENLERDSAMAEIVEEMKCMSQDNFLKKLPTTALVLPIMHGTFGEDGKLQGVLEAFGFHYAFSGVLASSLAMNKRKTKIIAKFAGLKIAKDVTVSLHKKYDIRKIVVKLGFPIVIKPSESGSSVGISIVNSETELVSGIEEALRYGNEVLLEQFIKGRELTVAVMENEKPKALPVIEIIPKVASWFDYQAKYQVDGSQEICPADIPDKIRKKIQRHAIKIFKEIGCLDLARADFIWSEKDNELYFLEINTIPGMTATSLVPQSAMATGMSFSDFLETLIDLAEKRRKL